MLPEIGHIFLIIAFCTAAWQVCSLFYNSQITIRLGFVQIISVVIAYIILTIAFLLDDFTVQYVAHTSNSNLAWYYKISAVWGAHEGSLLLWILILNIWYLAMYLCWYFNKWKLQFTRNVSAVMGIINLGLLLLLIKSSNPFARYMVNPPLDGADLNPMLQDFAMIIHPPILYLGYVGTTAAFAITIASLCTREIDRNWAQLVRPWCQLAWIFLTLGIALGSWWAYYELGWGGWWFWDPVENASFMPWLTATALLHILATSNRGDKLLRLAVFLVIVTFGLSIFGTFLVRSGAITSVHAFANDPERGRFILQFLSIVLSGAIFIFGLRWRTISAKKPLCTQDWFMLINNALLILSTVVILLGTLYPLIFNAITGDTISVTSGYFNAVFLPIILIMIFFMLPALVSAKRTILLLTTAMLIAGTFLYKWFGVIHFFAWAGLSLALALAFCSISLNKIGMSFAHLGLAVMIVGVSISANYEVADTLELKFGQSYAFAGHTLEFMGLDVIDGANYISYQANFCLDQVRTFIAEKRMYLAQEIVISETGILAGLFEDIYLVLGQEIMPGTWTLRVYSKPFVRWIWLGAFFLASGALLSILRNIKFTRQQMVSSNENADFLCYKENAI